MATRNMNEWQTSICQVVSTEEREAIIIRGEDLDDLVEDLSFAGMMYLMLQGKRPTPAETKTLDALLVASMEHGIAPPSMVARCFASYGTSLQAAVGGGILSFGDKMGGLGEQLAEMMVAELSDLADPISDALLEKKAESVVAGYFDAGKRVPGYGIPLHGMDPRAPKVMEIAKRHGVYGRYGRFADAIGAALARRRGGNPVPLNLDGVGAAVCLDLGFDWRATRLFLLTPRSVSMGAHFLEELGQDSTWRHIPANQIDYSDP